MAKKKESEFDKLARLIKEEGEDICGELSDQVGGLRKEMHEGFAPSTSASIRSSRYNSNSTARQPEPKGWRVPSSQNSFQVAATTQAATFTTEAGTTVQ